MVTPEEQIIRVLGSEGGYVNDPKDPGGETQWGITWPVLREAIALNIVPPLATIRSLTQQEAVSIYRLRFFNRINAGKLADGVQYQLLDFAVNSGIETAVRYFQRALGVADDGYWGPASQAAADATTESDMIMNLLAERLDFMTRLKNWPDAGKGWARRIARDLRYGAVDS